jgi:hypothetical protein
MPGFGIAMYNGLPVMTVPLDIADDGVLDVLEIFATDFDRYGQPQEPAWTFDEIAISPIPASVLHVIEQDELVRCVHQVEITPPRNIIGLYDRHFLAHICQLWNLLLSSVTFRNYNTAQVVKLCDLKDSSPALQGKHQITKGSK